MSELEQCFCPNEQCKEYGLRNQGNIAVRGKYGKDKSRELLYCRICGMRFASTQASALFGLHLPAETIQQIIHHAAGKAPTVARSIRWLKAKFAICVACYNLIRPHETLSRGKDRIFRPKTPAMAANVTDHRWTFSELLGHPMLCQ